MIKPLLTLPILGNAFANAQDIFEIKGLCIAAPAANGVDEFVKCIDGELGPKGMNTLVLRVGYN